MKFPFSKNNKPKTSMKEPAHPTEAYDYYPEPDSPLDEHEEPSILMQFPWIWDFDLTNPVDYDKAEEIAQLYKPNQSFLISKAIVSENGEVEEKQILALSHFPERAELWAAVNEEWGGGAYNIRARTKPKTLLKSYVYEGHRRVYGVASETRSAKEIREAREQELLEVGYEELRSNPELFQEFAVEYVFQKNGLKRPEPIPIDEKLIQEELENNPELRSELAKRALDKQFEIEKNKSEGLSKELRQIIQMADAFGWKRGGQNFDGIGEALNEFVTSGGIQAVVGSFQRPSAIPGQQGEVEQNLLDRNPKTGLGQAVGPYEAQPPDVPQNANQGFMPVVSKPLDPLQEAVEDKDAIEARRKATLESILKPLPPIEEILKAVKENRTGE